MIGDGVKLENGLKEGLWFECDRAKAKGQKGLWTQRYLEIFLENSDAKYLLRVDPDTCVWRPFSLPEKDCIFGNIEKKKYKYHYVRGGCIGFTRQVARKIVESRLLLDDRYSVYNYQRYKYFRWEHEEESDEEIALQDWIVADVRHRLKIELVEWNEFFILGNQNKVPEVGSFAVTHPHPII